MAIIPSSGQSIPILPQPTIERPRLLKTLETALQRKLTLVTAPPGYGKTTLVAQFAQQLHPPVIWQTLEGTDRDIPTLYTHTTAALAGIVPGLERLSCHLRTTASERVVQIIDHLRDSLTEDALYILDDVHYLIGIPGGDEWLQTLISVLPSKLHLIWISRNLPQLPLTEMIARREVVGIGQAQLRFTAAEIQEPAQHEDPVPQDFSHLIGSLEGWPAGVILALQPFPQEFKAPSLTEQTAPEMVFNRLVHDMLNAQHPLMQRFLLLSSTLSRVTPELCEHVLHLPDSTTYLAEGLQRNLFMQQVSGGVIYHALFRDFLQHHLQTQYPDEFSTLHRRAGEWFEAENLLDEAFAHYAAADLWQEAAALAQRAAQAYNAQGKIETLLHWNTQLQASDFSAPDLYYVCAMTHVDRYQYDLAAVELTQAAEGYHALEDTPGLLKVELLLGTLDNQQGNYLRAQKRAEALLEKQELTHNLRGHVLQTLGFAILQQGDAVTALQHFETSLTIYRVVRDQFATTQALSFLQLIYIRLGRLGEAGACLQEIVAILRSFGSITALAIALNDLGYYYHQMTNYEQAFQAFQQGLNAIRRSHQPRAEGYLLWSLGDLQRDRGAWDEAAQYYLQALSLTENREPSLTCGLLNSLAVLRRWQGRGEEADRLAEEALHLATEHHISLEHIKAEVNHWIARIPAGDPMLIEQKLVELANRLQQQQALIRLAQTWGLCALAALFRSDQAKAMGYFGSIEQFIPQKGNLQLLAAEIVHTPVLRAFVDQHLSVHSPVRDTVIRLAQAQVPLPAVKLADPAAPLPGYSLRVWTLGQEKVERDGIPVAVSRWRMMAREVFYYLLLRGPTPKSQIGLDFWPDFSEQQIRHNVHTTLHRIRKALGEKAIVFHEDSYRINPDLDLWCDAVAFESLVQEARLLAPRTVHAERLWQRAVELYQGDFLSSVDRKWADTERERLREIHLEALTGVGNCMRARSDYTKAIALYKRATQLEPYREDIHRLILSAYAEQGERQQIIKHYDELVAFLEAELAVEPSDETQALARTLLA